jgi:large subunit ribosomal protein L5e
MGFIKVVKNKAYFKRFKVKFRRRREAKTDYYARKRLIMQDKNKYKTPKYRFVVRRTNQDIICQIYSSDLKHDVCLASAYSHELKRYGITLGLTNWAAFYCVGLLLARRVNKTFNLDYEGHAEITGEDYHVEPIMGNPAPFKALLDVGLVRTTTGARVFGALKGACDGGVDIPHNDRRFPGSKKEGDDFKGDPEVVKKYIYGGHVADYMRSLQENEEEAYNRQFKRYVDAGVGPDDLEGLYKKAHAAIRKDPLVKRSPVEKGSFVEPRAKGKNPDFEYPKKRFNPARTTIEQKKARIRQKLTAQGVVSLKGFVWPPAPVDPAVAAAAATTAPVAIEEE